jgi:hypothetical protein
MEMVNVKAMPGSIPAPNSGSFIEKNKNIGSQTTKHLKKMLITLFLYLSIESKWHVQSSLHWLPSFWSVKQNSPLDWLLVVSLRKLFHKKPKFS